MSRVPMLRGVVKMSFCRKGAKTQRRKEQQRDVFFAPLAALRLGERWRLPGGSGGSGLCQSQRDRKVLPQAVPAHWRVLALLALAGVNGAFAQAPAKFVTLGLVALDAHGKAVRDLQPSQVRLFDHSRQPAPGTGSRTIDIRLKNDGYIIPCAYAGQGAAVHRIALRPQGGRNPGFPGAPVEIRSSRSLRLGARF
ncbi:hypothetical protein SBA3_990009 [Candidatus Sulfopaludibacter sp. SbA3]|nr:hypothetical protein SBA3_990009 [Candidatus Sulfopaludibacter sp. SbA3]